MKVHIDGQDVELTAEEEAAFLASLPPVTEHRMPHEIASFWDRFTPDEQRAIVEHLASVGVIRLNRVEDILAGNFPPGTTP